MSESSWSREGGNHTDSQFRVDGPDLVRTLNDLNSIELDCTKTPTELEFLRMSLRHKLPPDILVIHEKMIAEGKRSVAPRFANACTECSGEVVVKGGEKRVAETFLQCPHCGTLLYG
jgi:predicted  nucleic acid-binding Zn-ribbon protein